MEHDSRPDDSTVVVTGVAGFIGSATASLLLDRGLNVVGIDALTSNYPTSLKKANLATLMNRTGFRFIHAELDAPTCHACFADADAVVHLAGEPGVRQSWSALGTYLAGNVTTTKTVVDAAHRLSIKRVVYASSSSVYGNTPQLPTDETAPTRPVSPYGITKLAGEGLATAYGLELGLPTVSLRYFTVYGPAQRPDMAIHRLIAAAYGQETFHLFGDGRQARDFTYVDDVASANALAALAPDIEPGTVLNVCSEAPATMNEVISLIGEVTGRAPACQMTPAAPGDVLRTEGSAARLRSTLGWEPQTPLREGIRRQADAYLEATTGTGSSARCRSSVASVGDRSGTKI